MNYKVLDQISTDKLLELHFDIFHDRDLILSGHADPEEEEDNESAESDPDNEEDGCDNEERSDDVHMMFDEE